MIYLCNGISESMFIDPRTKKIPEPLTEAEYVNLVNKTQWRSCIGHEQMAKYLSKITGKNVKNDRLNINVSYDDVILLATVKGRLPEHPSYVEYKGRLTYSMIRFEKQTQMDIEQSLKIIEKLTMEA